MSPWQAAVLAEVGLHILPDWETYDCTPRAQEHHSYRHPFLVTAEEDHWLLGQRMLGFQDCLFSVVGGSWLSRSLRLWPSDVTGTGIKENIGTADVAMNNGIRLHQVEVVEGSGNI